MSTDWADQIVVDPYILDQAKKSTAQETTDKHNLVLWWANFLGLKAERIGRDLNPLHFAPKGKAWSRTNTEYNVLAKIVDGLPEELKTVATQDGQIVSSPLMMIDPRPWVNALKASGELSDDETKVADSIISSVNAQNDLGIYSRMQMIDPSISQTDQRVAQAQQRSRQDQTNQLRPEYGSSPARPTSKTPPSTPTPTSPQQPGDFNPQTGTAPPSSNTPSTSAAPPDSTMPPTTSGTTAGTTGTEFNLDKWLTDGGSQYATPQEMMQATVLGSYTDAGLSNLSDAFPDFTFDFNGITFKPSGGQLADAGAVSIQNAQQYMWKLDAKQYEDFQTMLFRAGYYTAIGQQPLIGIKDDATYLAWSYALADSVRSGKSITKFLADRLRGYAQSAIKEVGQYQDPVQIEMQARKYAQSILGRNLSTDEVNLFIKKVDEWERDISNQASSLLGTSVTAEGVQLDMDARAKDYFERTYAYDAFMQRGRNWASENGVKVS